MTNLGPLNSCPMRFRAARMLLVSLLFLRGGIAVDAQEDSQPTEYQIKAAFIFNFAKFVEWPSETFPKPSSPIVVGVLGENPFNDALEKTIQNKTVDEHPVIIRQFRAAAEA